MPSASGWCRAARTAASTAGTMPPASATARPRGGWGVSGGAAASSARGRGRGRRRLATHGVVEMIHTVTRSSQGSDPTNN